MLAEQGWRCFYCDGFIRMPGRLEGGHMFMSRRVATEEHIVPRVLGGSDLSSSGNVVMACAWCNRGWAAKIDLWVYKIFSPSPKSGRV